VAIRCSEPKRSLRFAQPWVGRAIFAVLNVHSSDPLSP
jgi:hypothetical protein